MMPTKKPIQSKTLWFNVLSIISVIGASLLADSEFRALIGSNATYIIIIMNVVNVALRFFTDKPIKVNPPVVTKPVYRNPNDSLKEF